MDCKHICFGIALIPILIINLISFGEVRSKSTQLVIKNVIEGPQLEYVKENRFGTVFKLNYKYMDDVHLVCEKVDYSQTDTLKWKIDYIRQTTCPEKHRKKIHYINRLEKKHHQATLTCEDNSKNFISVEMVCTDCSSKASIKNLLYLNCLASNEKGPAPIVTFINGESKTLKERKHEFKVVEKSSKTTVHCQSENDEVFWDWDKSTISKGATRTININDDNIVGLTISLTEAMDKQTLFCTSKKFQESVKIIFELTSDFYIVINNSRRSYRKLLEFPYQTFDNVTLECKEVIPYPALKDTVDVSWLQNSEFSKQCTVTPRKIQQSIKCHLTLTAADDGKNITCQHKYIQHNKAEPLPERAIIFKHQKVTTAPKYATTENSFRDKLTDHNNRSGTEINPVIIAIIAIAIAVIVIVIIVTVIYIKYRPGSKAVTVSYKNMQEPGPKEEATYASPVDQYEYSYAVAPGEQRSQQQYTYSTPFVPTLQEMYTQPMKKGKETLEYATLQKYQNLANTTKGVRNQPDPGYSTVSGGNSDTSSETYMYSRIK